MSLDVDSSSQLYTAQLDSKFPVPMADRKHCWNLILILLLCLGAFRVWSHFLYFLI